MNAASDSFSGAVDGEATNQDGDYTVGLALQGWGAQGSFTWGVLDRLLELGVPVKAITGTSSGSVNGLFAAQGLAQGDPELARQTLREGWTTFSDKSLWTPFQSTWMEKFMGTWPSMDNPYHKGFWEMVKISQPEFWNPTNINMLRDVVDGTVDFDAIQNSDDFRLFIAAVCPENGQQRVFTGSDITMDTVLASSNLRKMMHPVLVKGQELWDGGYMENPPVLPLVSNSDVSDIIMVMVVSSDTDNLPSTTSAIEERIGEIQYSAGAYKDAAHIEHMNDLIDSGALDPEKANTRRVNLHRIMRPREASVDSSACYNLDRAFLEQQFELGRQMADQWYQENKHKLGKQSTFGSRLADKPPFRPYGEVEGWEPPVVKA